MARPRTSAALTLRHVPLLPAEKQYATVYETRDRSVRIMRTVLGRNARRPVEGGWHVLHVQSGGVEERLWTLEEAVRLATQLCGTAATTAAATTATRWLVLPRRQPLHGQVLFDTTTGRWWARAGDRPVQVEELEAMEAAMPAATALHSKL